MENSISGREERRGSGCPPAGGETRVKSPRRRGNQRRVKKQTKINNDKKKNVIGTKKQNSVCPGQDRSEN